MVDDGSNGRAARDNDRVLESKCLIVTTEYQSSQRPRKSQDGVLVSVIIPTLNEEKVIAKCLESLVCHRPPRGVFEVIVVDNGSKDRTLDTVRRFEGKLDLTILQQKGCHVSAARNFGAASANGSFLAFLDADCIAPPDWLKSAIELLRAGDGGILGAFYTIPTTSSWVARAWYEDLPKLRRGDVSYVPCGTMFVSRNTFLRLGGFDAMLPTSEDFEFCQRVRASGYRVRAEPVLSTIHLGTPQTLAAFYKKQRWHGTGVSIAFRRDVFHRAFLKTVLQTSYSLVLLIAMVAAIPFSFGTKNYLILAIAPALLLIASFLLAMHAVVQRNKWSVLPALTIMYLVYGLARAMSLVGTNCTRARSPIPSMSALGESGRVE